VTATVSRREPAFRLPATGPFRLDPRIALGLITAGAVGVIALWWQDTFFIAGFGDWLTNAGRITGLLAGYAVVVLLALMARIPAVERGVGSDRLARWHAMGGRYTVCLSVAHTLLIIWGYAVTAHTNVVHETWSMLTSYVDVLMATVALGLLLLVGITSARAARRRLRYETWHYIHFYTYLAIALAFSHQFATGADFVSNLKARVLWSALYIVVAALLIWYRMLAPVRDMVRHDLRVAGVQPESADIVSVYITGRNLESLHAEPGQFFRWRFLTRGLWWAANPYSLSAAPRDDMLRITVKVTGDHSAALRDLRRGTRVIAEGPSGGFTAARRRQRRVLLIGGGVGITPIRAILETIPAGASDIAVLYRTNRVDEIVLRHELDDLAARRHAHVHYLVGPPKRGANDHLSPQRLSALVPDVAQRDVFLCGPEPMMAAARRSLLQAGVPARHIHSESFAF
jgi:predicted ferric reductase